MSVSAFSFSISSNCSFEYGILVDVFANTAHINQANCFDHSLSTISSRMSGQSVEIKSMSLDAKAVDIYHWKGLVCILNELKQLL